MSFSPTAHVLFVESVSLIASVTTPRPSTTVALDVAMSGLAAVKDALSSAGAESSLTVSPIVLDTTDTASSPEYSPVRNLFAMESVTSSSA